MVDKYNQFGFDLFTRDDKPFNLNLYGIRTDSNEVDTMNDWLGVMWVYQGNFTNLVFKGTTDPGLFYLGKDKMGNSEGTFMLLGQHQHFGLFKKGKHKGQYVALVQNSVALGLRDFNRNGKLDPVGGEIKEGHGINWHRARSIGRTEKVGPYSAGCQVNETESEHQLLMKIIDLALREGWKNSFSYTLFEEKYF